MKKFLNRCYRAFFGEKNKCHTEIRLTFDQQTNNPNVTLHLSDLNDKTAQELAKIFYIFQTGAVQQFLIEKIAHISAENNVLFLENVYDNFNKLDSTKETKRVQNTKQPMVRPLAVFNNNASNN